jgi:hypothetical protein
VVAVAVGLVPQIQALVLEDYTAAVQAVAVVV